MRAPRQCISASPRFFSFALPMELRSCSAVASSSDIFTASVLLHASTSATRSARQRIESLCCSISSASSCFSFISAMLRACTSRGGYHTLALALRPALQRAVKTGNHLCTRAFLLQCENCISKLPGLGHRIGRRHHASDREILFVASQIKLFFSPLSSPPIHTLNQPNAVQSFLWCLAAPETSAACGPSENVQCW